MAKTAVPRTCRCSGVRQEPEARDVLSARVRPGRSDEVPVTMSASASGTRPTASQSAASGGCLTPPTHEVVRAEHDDDGHADSEEREEEVRHHDQRMQLHEHGDPPEHAL